VAEDATRDPVIFAACIAAAAQLVASGAVGKPNDAGFPAHQVAALAREIFEASRPRPLP
jgi:hypothetical protein